jgi:hypothetical protein
MIRIKDKESGKIIDLPESTYEVGDAFIVPLQCYYKEYYELVKEKKEKT